MCSQVSMNDLFVVHHEMGHVQYYMNYRNQPFQFKEGANPGFHEAIGDLMALSAMTPGHLHKIKLINQYVDDKGKFTL
jgi:peptidyl-dipeptidase A